MITYKRRLLVFSGNKQILEELKKFEGIGLIKDFRRTEYVWGCNKTPIIEKSRLDGKTISYPTLDIPEFGTDLIKEFTKWSHDNGFECGEYRTGVLINTREEPCVLCSIANHMGINNRTTIYNSSVKKESDCIIYESPGFYITSELGALKHGFLMIVPKEHNYLSIAQLPERYMGEYLEVCEDIEEILKGTFGDKPVTFFEHGSGPSGFTSHKKSIVHAHTHVVIDFEIDKEYLDMIQMKPLDDLSKAKDTHYFAYKVGARGQRLCCYNDEVYVQRQFPRQIMAMKMGYTPDQHNWRKYDFNENIHTTLYYLFRYLSTSELSGRIAERTKEFVHGYALRDDFEA